LIPAVASCWPRLANSPVISVERGKRAVLSSTRWIRDGKRESNEGKWVKDRCVVERSKNVALVSGQFPAYAEVIRGTGVAG
jgi:hypothetical protein